MEGSIKFVYMLHGTPDEIRTKVIEYWETLPRFTATKHSERARRFLEAVPHPDAAEWQPFRDLILSETEISRIRESCTHKECQAIEERWSFVGSRLSGELASSLAIPASRASIWDEQPPSP